MFPGFTPNLAAANTHSAHTLYSLVFTAAVSHGQAADPSMKMAAYTAHKISDEHRLVNLL